MLVYTGEKDVTAKEYTCQCCGTKVYVTEGEPTYCPMCTKETATVLGAVNGDLNRMAKITVNTLRAYQHTVENLLTLIRTISEDNIGFVKKEAERIIRELKEDIKDLKRGAEQW
ncbi:hypothetical protein [Archaeoglobus neptunius]|uniref:hypothetical protein n=1 Tax=Archaeoglobus neptunius TaxID=2798580 RepID=UPI001929145E|nr:hypothetical protein [Archaeoglobus neptunius]